MSHEAVIISGARTAIGTAYKGSLTETVRSWADYGPGWLPLPHPSPRNTLWLRKNPWFEDEIVPHLEQRVAPLLARP